MAPKLALELRIQEPPISPLLSALGASPLDPFSSLKNTAGATGYTFARTSTGTVCPHPLSGHMTMGFETKAAILFPPLHDFRKKTEIMKVWSPDSRASKPFFLLRTTERERERKLSEARDSAGEKRNENWGGGMAAAAAAQKSTREAPVQTGWGGERPP